MLGVSPRPHALGALKARRKALHPTKLALQSEHLFEGTVKAVEPLDTVRQAPCIAARKTICIRGQVYCADAIASDRAAQPPPPTTEVLLCRDERERLFRRLGGAWISSFMTTIK